MMKQCEPTVLTAASPAASSTSIHPLRSGYFSRADKVVIEAALVGATGGTLDVYIQRKVTSNVWADIIHFPQLAAGAAAVRYSATLSGEGGPTAPTVIGIGSDGTPSPALAANTVINTLPGDELRVVLVTGAGAAAGASQTIYATPFYAVG